MLPIGPVLITSTSKDTQQAKDGGSLTHAEGQVEGAYFPLSVCSSLITVSFHTVAY